MKKLLLSLGVLLMPLTSALGVPPPSVYKKAKSRSSENLIIRAGRVVHYNLRDNTVYVKIKAKVLMANRSKHGLRRGNWITIRYRTQRMSSRDRFGASALPIPRQGQVYRVYLNRSKRGWYYMPAAGNQSFIKINNRRRKSEHKRRNIRF